MSPLRGASLRAASCLRQDARPTPFAVISPASSVPGVRDRRS
ncbi:hypothetical protein [Methanocalculus sp.]|nr:hypothetical protein [Methanocalculus sp.]MDG6249507.1 hypothetical protein [Methanocalculus sp.]